MFANYASKNVVQQLMPALFPVDEGSSAVSPWPVSPSSSTDELVSVYDRMKATIRSNDLAAGSNEDVKFSNTLSQ